MACRNVIKAQKAAEEIAKEVPNCELVIVHLNLASQESVRKCAAEISNLVDHIDLLINNAGVFMCPYSETEDGFEMHLGVNYFGHFSLTMLLLDKLKRANGSRVVNVASSGYKSGSIQ